MTLEEMQAMPLNTIEDSDVTNYAIQRVPNGWLYLHFVSGVSLSATFVPEMLPIQQYALPTLQYHTRGEQ